MPDPRFELHQRLLRKKSIPTLEQIPLRDLKNLPPLSFAQQRLLFLNLLDPGNPYYNIHTQLYLRGRLEAQLFRHALNEIVRRHEALRTSFGFDDGQPVQLIHQSVTVELPVVDLSGLRAKEREEAGRRLATEEGAQPFDLTAVPLLRARLLRLEPEYHIALFTMHHIVSDGWSMGVLVREIGELYQAGLEGRPPNLPELPIQYADFAVWQRQWLSGEVLERQLSYWRERLEGSTGVLELPTDRPRPAVQSYRGATYTRQLSKGLTAGLKGLSEREGATLFMTLLSGFQALLYRYTGQSDIVAGTPIANRNRAELEGLIGFFVNTLVMRAEVKGEMSYRELLGQVRETALGAYAHQDLPFEKLVEELRPERDLSRSPVFQLMFVLQNAPVEALNVQEVKIEPAEVEGGTAKFDLILAVGEEDGGLAAGLEYNRELFDLETIEGMASHYERLLAGMVADPDRKVSDLPLLSEREREQILVEWNRTETHYPEQCIHELFEQQARRTPDVVAMVCGERQISYAELNRRTNQLARYLQKLGVKPETPVGVCVERSVEIVVGLIGILKAGGAYVPLDANYPAERLGFMLEDTQASVVVTQESMAGNLHVDGLRLVRLDSDWNEVGREWEGEVAARVQPDNLAYVIYTSGSIGQPKGTDITHRGVIRLLFGVDYVDLSDRERLLQLAPVSFDASTFEIWGSLLYGGLCVLLPNRVPTFEDLSSALRCHGVTATFMTASLFNATIDQSPDALRGIEQLLIGGEALSASHIRRALAHLPSTKLINGYGPTECTTFSVCYSIPRQAIATGSIPIGQPISNTNTYILDNNFEPVPVGVHGNLFIGGPGLARGYHNRPELTAEKFTPHRFRSGARLYETGDLARHLRNGQIEFLGRADYQVKIRGFRIEPGEIETVMCLHSAVREAVVIARPDFSGTKRLIAYAVLEKDISINDLRQFLREKLPDYMVPSAFMILEKFPLTANGKIDRSALPSLEGGRPNLGTAYVEPKTELQRTISDIWQEVLGLNRVGLQDNFFDLGGHSLLLIQVHHELKERLQVELRLVDLFRYPTIDLLAGALSEREKEWQLSRKTRRQAVRNRVISRQKQKNKGHIHG